MPEGQQAAAEGEGLGPLIAPDVAPVQQRQGHAIDAVLRKAQLASDLREAHAIRPATEQFEDGEGSLEVGNLVLGLG